nr:hypothetical protein [Candidatus Sigynarchaeota archaeon]
MAATRQIKFMVGSKEGPQTRVFQAVGADSFFDVVAEVCKEMNRDILTIELRTPSGGKVLASDFDKTVDRIVTQFGAIFNIIDSGSYKKNLDNNLDIINFQSTKPEELLANINKLHVLALEAIGNKDYEDAKTYLVAEHRQYVSAMNSLQAMGMAGIVEKLKLKVKAIESMLPSVYDAIFVLKYNELQQQSEAAKTSRDYESLMKLLYMMKDITAERLAVAQAAYNVADMAKFQSLIQDIESQAEYARLFVEYKKFEAEYNLIAATITRGNLQDGMIALQDLRKRFDVTFGKVVINGVAYDTLAIGDLMQKVDAWMKDPKTGTAGSAETAVLHQKKIEFRNAMANLAVQVERQYERLVESMTTEQIVVKPLNADLVAPRVVNADSIEDLGSAIENLDRQFAAWNKAEKTKDGKLSN